MDPQTLARILLQVSPNTRVQQDFEALGMLAPGNVNLGNRPMVPMPGGGVGTVHSMSFGDNGQTLVPTITPSGALMSPEQAIDYYYRTGQHLGRFATPEQAGAYAKLLSQSQGIDYGIAPYELPTEVLKRQFNK